MTKTTWDPLKPSKISVQEAVAIQTRLAKRVSTKSRLPKRIRRIAGLDATYVSGRTLAAAAMLDFPSLEVLQVAVATLRTPFPYIPGLLGFREAPGVLRALKKLGQKPQVCLADGHGLAHPRGFGLACMLGVYSGIPTIGIAKSHLFGRIVGDRILDKEGKEIGRTIQASNNRTLYVSVGHKVNPDDAVRIVKACMTEQGLKPITVADREVSNRRWNLNK